MSSPRMVLPGSAKTSVSSLMGALSASSSVVPNFCDRRNVLRAATKEPRTKVAGTPVNTRAALVERSAPSSSSPVMTLQLYVNRRKTTLSGIKLVCLGAGVQTDGKDQFRHEKAAPPGGSAAMP